MSPMIPLMSRLPGDHSMSAGRRPEKARLPTVDSLLVGTTRVPTERSDRHLGGLAREVTRRKSVYDFITARCTLVQSAVLRSHVVCLSVCL